MSFGADDWIICIALLLNWAMYALAARGAYTRLFPFKFPLASMRLFARVASRFKFISESFLPLNYYQYY
jgi:hypothetical protein